MASDAAGQLRIRSSIPYHPNTAPASPVHHHAPPTPDHVHCCITLHNVQQPAAPADPYAHQPDDYQQGMVPNDPQLVWLKEDLTAFNRKNTPFLIVGFHTPIYNTYIVGCSGCPCTLLAATRQHRWLGDICGSLYRSFEPKGLCMR